MKKEVSIHIGEFYASNAPIIINTLLGSCVAVCLFDPIRQIGGMNHILMPGKADLRNFDTSASYGINAMELLINRIMVLGGNRRHLVAKVFGGANVIPTISEENGMGRKNEAFVVEFLQIEKIKIISQDLGGNQSRRIYFHTDTGDVFLRRIRFAQFQNVVNEEQKCIKRIRKELKKPGMVDLF
jgi:chemotaxis protein CheD